MNRSLLLFLCISAGLSFPAAHAQTLYALDDDARVLHSMLVDTRRGRFELSPTTPIPIGGVLHDAPRRDCNLSLSRNGDFLFVGRASGLVAVQRLRDGSHRVLEGTSFPGIEHLLGVVSRTRGQTITVYAVQRSTSQLRIFDLSLRTGLFSLRPQAPSLGTAGGATCLAIENDLLCALNESDGQLHMFSIDARTGSVEAWSAGPFEVPVWTPNPTQLRFDAQQTTLILNHRESGMCSVLDIDLRARELRYARPLPTGHRAQITLGVFRRNGRAFWIAGDRGIQVFDAQLVPQALAPLALAAVERMHIEERSALLFVTRGRELAMLEWDQRTELPLPPHGFLMRDLFQRACTALLYAR